MQVSKLIFWFIIFGIIILFLNEVRSILTPFIASLIIAYFLDPLTIRLEKLKVKRGLTVSIIVGVFFLILVLSFIRLVPSLIHQVKAFILHIPDYEKYFAEFASKKLDGILIKVAPDFAETIRQQFTNLSSEFFKYIMSAIQSIFDSGMAIFNLVGLILFTPILVFYLLRDWPSFTKNIKDILPINQKKVILDLFSQIDKVLSSYVRGQMSVCLLLALFYIVSLSLVGLDYALLVGIIAGFLAIIPYLGLIIGGLICALVALIQFSDLKHMYITLVIFLFGHLIESYIITPKLVGEKVGLNPVWVIFSIMAGGALFGFWGMFFAVPIAAIVGVIIRSLVMKKLY